MGVQINGSEGNVIATKGTFSGDVGIGGTLTYEDVTNIDSVGLITARSGIEIGASPGVAASISVDGNMIVSGISTFGGDVQVPDKIIHTGDTDTAIRFPAADTITAETGGTERLRISSDGKLTHTSSFTEIVDFGTTSATGAYHKYDLSANGATTGYIGAGNHLVVGANVADFSFRSQANMLFSTGGDTERLRIQSDGKVISHTPGGDDAFLVKGDTYTGVRIQAARESSSDKAMFQMLGSRGTNASPTILQSGDTIGTLTARGYDGNSYAQSANIVFKVSATPGDGDMPGAIELQTSADGVESTSEGLKLDHNGHVTTARQFHIEVRRTDDQTGYVANANFGVPMIFTDVVRTRGTANSALDTSTGKITVPVDGVYFLEASVFTSTGNYLNQAWFTEGTSRMQYSDHTQHDESNKIQASGMHYLSANTEVGFHPYGTTATSLTLGDSIYHTWFRVTLMG